MTREPKTTTSQAETSAARKKAAQENGRKSGGPRTARGKGISSKNAYKHGLTAQAFVAMPGEDPAAHRAFYDAWMADAKPRTMQELAVAEDGCQAAWNLRRARRQGGEAMARRARNDLDSFAVGRTADAAARLRALTDDPINRCDEPPTDREGRERLRAYYETDPAQRVAELCLSVEGVEALRTRWGEMADRLHEEGYWHYPDKFAAIRMLGHRPEDSLDDPVAVRITLACRALHPEAFEPWMDHTQSSLGLENRPAYHLRVEALEKRKPGKEEALKTLWGYIRGELHRLSCLLDDLRAKREVERAAVVPLALFDDSQEGMLRLRYEATWSRVLHKSVAELAKLQKDRGSIDNCESDECEAEAESDAPGADDAP